MFPQAIHLAPGEHHAGVLRALVETLGRDDEIVMLHDDGLHVGPLDDVDDGAARRMAWWRKLGCECDLDDRATWDRVRADGRPVVVWHGPFPSERLFALRAFWQLREQPQRLHEVYRPTRTTRWGNGGPRPSFYDGVGIAGPKVLLDDWKTMHPISDVEARARRWEALRQHRGILELEGDDFIERPEDAYDDRFLAACRDWTSSHRVVGRVLSETPMPTAFLAWRIERLIEDGRLESRGAPNPLDLPEEIRAR